MMVGGGASEMALLFILRNEINTFTLFHSALPNKNPQFAYNDLRPNRKTILQKAQITKPLCDEPYSIIFLPCRLLLDGERAMAALR